LARVERAPDGNPKECRLAVVQGLFCGASEVKRTKIASVPATPFTWKGYVGRNFETELNWHWTPG
jgi:hypothetical protein